MSTTPRRTRSHRGRSAATFTAGLVAAILTVVGAASAQAAPDQQLTASSETVTADGAITLTASGFPENGSLDFTIDGAPLTTYPVTGSAVAAGSDGEYKGTARIPASLEPGQHLISVAYVSDTYSVNASTQITVVPQPTSSVTPATQSLSEYLKNGVTATFTGFTPGDTVSFGISTPATGDQAGPDAVADATGTVTLRFVPEAGTNYAHEGTYTLDAFTEAGAIQAAPLSFTVTADAAASTPVAGPATPVKRAATFTG